MAQRPMSIVGYIPTIGYNENLKPIVPVNLAASLTRYQIPEAATHPGLFQARSEDIPTRQLSLRPVVSPAVLRMMGMADGT